MAKENQTKKRKLMNKGRLADSMDSIMDKLDTLDPTSEEYAAAVKNLQTLYNIGKSECEMDYQVRKDNADRAQNAQIQQMKNDAENSKNTKLLAGTVLGAAITGAVTIGVANACRQDEDDGRPWLSKATGFIPKFKGR